MPAWQAGIAGGLWSLRIEFQKNRADNPSLFGCQPGDTGQDRGKN